MRNRRQLNNQLGGDTLIQLGIEDDILACLCKRLGGLKKRLFKINYNPNQRTEYLTFGPLVPIH